MQNFITWFIMTLAYLISIVLSLLQGNQQHEIVRVIVQCCLQEKAWNPFYPHLISKLCSSGIPGHKTTLQYCLWDQFKEAGDIEIRRMDNLAKLTAWVLAWGVVPLRILKVRGCLKHHSIKTSGLTTYADEYPCLHQNICSSHDVE